MKWTETDKQNWLNQQKIQRSYQNEVVAKIQPLSKRQIPGVNVIMPIATGDKSLLDFDQRRFFIDAGSRSARDQVNGLVSQYGF